ncbi:3(2),5-bisphosphate nucleotidase HAL2 [Laetiporus sulphureus 93-53]|uniref:3'(2'),5'-bisphosphate nucleotidase n=1 Tax=Laetiporus sulphureus 93-53 TaxID=1314785 RepID=A0A165CM52_9APHY|nr:3(2),5-bisphosphate nucleotidase HAL2 [Laetiporus sulphureus 93-53]KZT03058.1 3(2),5-bisphosphate nucleotidase HAL2 [Laetiporus sulphureus 93-53]
MSLTYSTERQVAIAAVRRACALTSSVFNKLVRNETLTKDDKSPVTVGDFSAQAVVNIILGRTFPKDPIVGEEDSADLRGDSSASLRERVVELANEALTAPLQTGEKEQWGLGPSNARTAEELMDAVDRGNYPGGRTGRMWTLDPIDGTKGFLRGEQYAVCLALLVDARVQLGVIGCPNLPVDPANPSGARGCIFVAERGHGAYQIPVSASEAAAGAERRLVIPSFAPDQLSLLESVEKAHSKLSFNERVAHLLGVTRPPTRMDSQAKYCALVRGEGGVYLRMPTGTGYKEKIWDHAPGSVLVEEAGGVITDSRGEPLDFGLGRTLGENYGVVAAGRDVHSRVIEAVKRAKEEEAKGDAQGQ